MRALILTALIFPLSSVSFAHQPSEYKKRQNIASENFHRAIERRNQIARQQYMRHLSRTFGNVAVTYNRNEAAYYINGGEYVCESVGLSQTVRCLDRNGNRPPFRY